MTENPAPSGPVLEGHKAIVFGIANEESIAYGCARALRSAGADLAVSWLNGKARPFVEPLAQELEASITGEVDVSVAGQLEAMFEQVRATWGRLDILVHSIAFAPKSDLQGGLLECSAEGFAKAMRQFVLHRSEQGAASRRRHEHGARTGRGGARFRRQA